MSSVRMCDKCRTIFSENDEGWQTATLQTVEYDENGHQFSVPIRQDLCSECAVETPKRRSKKSSELDARIAHLEASNKKLEKLTKQIDDIKTGS